MLTVSVTCDSVDDEESSELRNKLGDDDQQRLEISALKFRLIAHHVVQLWDGRKSVLWGAERGQRSQQQEQTPARREVSEPSPVPRVD